MNEWMEVLLKGFCQVDQNKWLLSYSKVAKMMDEIFSSVCILKLPICPSQPSSEASERHTCLNSRQSTHSRCAAEGLLEMLSSSRVFSY